jgi:uncharacterized protein YutE (UPF0331/DUF86 family)
MSPQITKKKVEKVFEYLKVLEKYQDISYEDFLADAHFISERLLKLLVNTSADLLMHKMALVGESIPTTMRTTFLRAGELNWIPVELAQNLANAAGIRNLLVHGYEKIDLKIIHESIKSALIDFTEFCDSLLTN